MRKLVAVLFLALKDVLKDKKILMMIIFVIGISVTSAITITGLFNGFGNYFNDVTINVLTGHLTIFPKENENYVKNVGEIERKIELLPEVKGVSPRLAANGIAFKENRENKESQVRITGLTASKETKTTMIADKVVDGEFLSDNDKGVLMGSALADNLKVKIGEKVGITFRNGVVREYKIKGFLNTGARSGDDVAVYMSNNELEDALGVKDSASQILVKLTDIGLVDKSKTNILQLGVSGDIKTWKEMSSYVEAIRRNFDFIFGVINFIGLTAAAVSVAVVMFINVEHKTREIGILKAIGARNSFVRKVFITEILLYAAFGVFLGNMIGLAILTYLQSGSALQFAWSSSGSSVGSISIIPSIAFTDIVQSSITVFIVTFVSGLYPVSIATRMDMIKAIWGE